MRAQATNSASYFAKKSDDELNAIVAARAANLNRNFVRTHRPGAMQREVLAALRATPMSVHNVHRNVTVCDYDKAIDTLAGLLARDLIERDGDQWRAKR
jgi:hypothetical protein